MPIGNATFNFKGLLPDPTLTDAKPSDKAQGAKTPTRAQTTGAADGTSQPAGAGSAAEPTTAPDVNSTNHTVAVATIAVALMSLSDLMPSHMESSDSRDVDLAAALAKLKKTQDNVDKGKITTDSQAQKAALDSQKKQLEEAQKKTEQAAESAKHVSLADKFKAAFTWIGAIVAVIVAAVLIATGVGAAVGVALIAAAVIAVAMAVDQTVELANRASGKDGSLSMFGMMFKSIGESAGLSGEALDKFTAKATMGLNIALMIVSIALSFVNPEGAESAVAQAAELGPNMAKLGANATRMEKIVAQVQDIGVKVAGDVKTAVKDIMEAVKDAKSTMAAMKEEGLVVQLQKAATKIESLVEDLGRFAKKGVGEIKGELKDLLAEVKSAKDMLVKMKQEGPAKQVEKAYVELKKAVDELVGGALLKGLETVGDVKKGFQAVKGELQALKQDGLAEYTLAKLKEGLMDLAEGAIAKVVVKDEKTGIETFSGVKTAKSIRDAGHDVQNKGNTAATAASSVYQYQADTAIGESKVASASAKMDEALAKAMSASIDMVLAMMKKHGEAFDAQIDQAMDMMHSHMQALTSRPA